MLSSRAQRWLKALHELLVAVLIGSTAALAALLWLRPALPAGRDGFALDLAAYWLFSYPLTWSFYGLVGTGLAFSLFTGWSALRYRWVACKWLGFAALFAAAWLALGPAVHGLVGLSDAGLVDAAARTAHAAHGRGAALWSAAFLAVLAAMVPLSVLKPWGRWGLRRTLPRRLALTLAGLLVIALGGLGLLQAWTLAGIRALPVPEADLSRAWDGSYEGQVVLAGTRTAVRAQVRDRRLVALEVLENRRSTFAQLAEGVLPRILARQRAGVDAITGATTTSRALQLAVADALAQAVPPQTGPPETGPAPAWQPCPADGEAAGPPGSPSGPGSPAPATAGPPGAEGPPQVPGSAPAGELAGCARGE